MKKTAIVLLLTCVGCAAHKTYPVLEATKDSDPDLSCRLLDDEILEANELRDEIIQEHGGAISDAVFGTSIDAVFNPVNAVIGGIMRSVSVSKATKHYAIASAAAGTRMEQLLRYKKAKDCRSGTVEGGMPAEGDILNIMTDNDLVDMLDALLGEYEAGEIDEKAYVLRRAEILDMVRY